MTCGLLADGYIDVFVVGGVGGNGGIAPAVWHPIILCLVVAGDALARVLGVRDSTCVDACRLCFSAATEGVGGQSLVDILTVAGVSTGVSVVAAHAYWAAPGVDGAVAMVDALALPDMPVARSWTGWHGLAPFVQWIDILGTGGIALCGCWLLARHVGRQQGRQSFLVPSVAVDGRVALLAKAHVSNGLARQFHLCVVLQPQALTLAVGEGRGGQGGHTVSKRQFGYGVVASIFVDGKVVEVQLCRSDKCVVGIADGAVLRLTLHADIHTTCRSVGLRGGVIAHDS